MLADPRITTISGRTATIRAGDNIAILTTTGGGTPVLCSIRDRSAAFCLSLMSTF